jgi:hypothetical protein
MYDYHDRTGDFVKLVNSVKRAKGVRVNLALALIDWEAFTL